MAVNAYLVIDGIKGPSTSKKDAIDVLSFSFGSSNASTLGAGASGAESRAGRADISDLNIMKVLDKTSPLLFESCVTGKKIPKVELIYDKPMGDKQEDYYKIHLEDAHITSVQQSGSSENPTESLSIAFAKIKISYNPEKIDGKSLEGWVEKGFDTHKLIKW